MKMKKLVFAVALACAPVSAFAGGAMTGGATMPEQIVQEATLVESKFTEAQQLVQQIQQYENMIQNMVTLPQTLINQIMAPIGQMYSLAQQAQALGTAGQNIAQQFQNMNVTFNPSATSGYEQSYSTITSNLNNAINNALQSANLNPTNFLTQQQAMQQVSQAMQNPQSRNAILQAGVAVGQAEVSDLTQLQQTATSEENMQAAYLKKKTLRDNADNQANQQLSKAFFGSGNQSPNLNVGPSVLSNMQPIPID